MVLKERAEREIRKRKREYGIRISHKAKKNPKLFFSYIRNKKNFRNNIGPLVDNDNKLISDGKDMASIFNSMFSRVFTEEGKADIPTRQIYFKAPMKKSSSQSKFKHMRFVNIYTRLISPLVLMKFHHSYLKNVVHS